ncbi:MAG: Precorrin-3B methylase [Leptolyngbyaceae cyanobacterium T60_A2020_046]|nr:Precorrin-3B methylase [Leptolyngbyaceae cyanobacterium T60_A2020_046]
MNPAEPPLEGAALVKEVCRRIRVARSYWDAHNNAACRRERDRALTLYNTLTKEQKAQIPEVLKVWLRYRSEKYFGDHRTPPGTQRLGRGNQGKRRSRNR